MWFLRSHLALTWNPILPNISLVVAFADWLAGFLGTTSPNYKMYLSQLQIVFFPIAKCICPNCFGVVVAVAAVAGQVFWWRPPQRPVLWPAHCSQKTPHVDFFLGQFIESTAMALLTERNIQQFKDRGFTQASKGRLLQCFISYA